MLSATRADVRCCDCGRACPEFEAVRRMVVTGYSSGLRGRRFYNRVTLCACCDRRHRRADALRRAWKLARRVVLVVVVIALLSQYQAAVLRLERRLPRLPNRPQSGP